jgi:very-short-patch-repair endonuclease
MPPRIPLPEPLDSMPFSLRTGLDRGVGRGRLAGPDLQRPYPGVRTAIDAGPAALYAPRLRPGDRFSHVTALALWGAPLPWAHERAIHVASPRGSRHRMRGVAGHESSSTTTCRRSGMPVSPPLAAFLEAAPLLDLDDLVAVGDHLVLDPRVLDPLDLRPYLAIDDLLAGTQAFRGRGARRAHAAAALVRVGVESPRETALRLLLIRAQLPQPLCGFELCRPDGRTIGWFDLAWPDFRVIAEYDGDQHRTSTRQYERDIRRFDQADELGWKVIRVRDHGIRNPHETIARVTTALTARGWLAKRRSNTPW